MATAIFRLNEWREIHLCDGAHRAEEKKSKMTFMEEGEGKKKENMSDECNPVDWENW